MLIKLIKDIIPPYKLPLEAASAIIKNNKNQYLLLKRSKLSKSYRHYWQLPEGKIDIGEKPKQTLLRELEEEIGYKYKLSELKFIRKQRILVNKYGLPLLYIDRHLFSAPNPSKIVLSSEHQDYGYFDIKQIQNLPNTLPGLVDLLKASKKASS